MASGKVLSIDFGTSCTVFAMTNTKSRFEPEVVEIDGKPFVETVVRLDETGGIEMLGTEAWEHIDDAPERTYFEFKMDIGRIGGPHAGSAATGGKPSAKDLGVIFLRRTREKIERQHFNGASLTEQGVVTIIGYPAEWTERQREETLAMAREAGFPDVQGCEEPIGVLYFQHYKGDLSVDRGQIVLVYDFGGGTSDVAVVRTRAGEKPKVLGCGGANNLGGRNFDEAVYTLLLKQSDLNAQALDPRDAVTIRRAARTLKEKLSAAMADGRDSVESTVTLRGLRAQKRMRLASRDFEECCDTLIRMFSGPVWEALNRADISPEEIDISILAGGSARMHYVHKALDDMFPEDMVLQSLNPGEVVAKGLAIYGRVLQEDILSQPSQSEPVVSTKLKETLSIKNNNNNIGMPSGLVSPRKKSKMSISQFYRFFAVFIISILTFFVVANYSDNVFYYVVWLSLCLILARILI